MPTIPITGLELVVVCLSVVFTLWPVFILAGLAGRNHVLTNMLIMWGVVAIARTSLAIKPTPPLLPSIPEPLSTTLFLATGTILLSLKVGLRLQRRRSLLQVGDGARGPSNLLTLSPLQFEEMVVELFRAEGHKAVRTGQIGDHGVDVRIHTKQGEKWVVQCKRWRGAVGEPIVRDFWGVVQHEKADRGVIVTTGRFTASAQEWARGKAIELYDGKRFLNAWRRARSKWQAPAPDAQLPLEDIALVPNSQSRIASAPPLCPRCQVPMVIRTARRGAYSGQQFYGCMNYPSCREVVPSSPLPSAAEPGKQ